MKRQNTLPFSFLILNLLFQLKMLRVGHDNSGSNSRWLLEEVVIFSLVRGERYVFKCGNWIGGRHNDIELPLGKQFDLLSGHRQLQYSCIKTKQTRFQCVTQLMKGGRAAKRVISNLKEIGFLELALFTLSFSFHPNPVVASTHPTPLCLPYLLE